MLPGRLTKNDIELVLIGLRGEKRRLLMQLAHVRDSIKRLRAKQAKAPTERRPQPIAPPKPPAPEGPEAALPRGKRKGYRLNAWDLMISGAIGERGRLMRKQEILEVARAWARKELPHLNGPAVEALVTRALQKLSGKRGVLGALRTGTIRGYHYGLREWFSPRGVKLLPEHKAKLVLKPEAPADDDAVKRTPVRRKAARKQTGRKQAGSKQPARKQAARKQAGRKRAVRKRAVRKQGAKRGRKQ